MHSRPHTASMFCCIVGRGDGVKAYIRSNMIVAIDELLDLSVAPWVVALLPGG